jgi:hypothetical protein
MASVFSRSSVELEELKNGLDNFNVKSISPSATILGRRAAGVCVTVSSVMASATSVSTFETLFWSSLVCVCFVRRRLSRWACHIRVWLSGSSSETESSRDLQSLASGS